MKTLITPMFALSLLSGEASAETTTEVRVNRAGAQPSIQGAAQNFTGTVHVDGLFNAEPPARVGGATVTFEPGARTAWHTHPLGQTLVVTAGVGYVQQQGGSRQEIRPGDTVWIPPHVRHWHGATATSSMTHIAIAEAENGTAVTWAEKVSDTDYAGGAAPSR